MAVGSRPVVSCRISLWAERGRTIARKAGRWRANTRAPTRQQRPPIRTMWGAVRCVATVPATRPPATAWAEGAQFNGRPFPATVWAEGGQFNGPSFPATASAEGAQFNGRPSSAGTLVRVLEPPFKAGVSQGRLSPGLHGRSQPGTGLVIMLALRLLAVIHGRAQCISVCRWMPLGYT